MIKKTIFILLSIVLNLGAMKNLQAQWQETIGAGMVGGFGSIGSKILVNSAAGLLLSNDSGVSWVQLEKDTHAGAIFGSAIVSNGPKIFASGAYSGLLSSIDSGITWTKVDSNILTTYIWSLISNDNTIIAASGIIFRSTDNGNDWSVVDTIGAPMIDFTKNGNDLFASTYGKGVFRTTDNGSHWTNVIPDSAGLTYSYWHIAIIGNDVMATATWSERAFLSSNNGTTWDTLHIPTPYNFSGPNIQALAVSGSNIFAGYTDAVGGVMLSTDTGKSWKEIGNMHRVSSLYIFGDYIFAGTTFGVYRARLSDFIEQGVHLISSDISKFNILSNPITSSADFQFDALKEPTVFELFDLLGRLVLWQQLSAGQASLHVNMQNMPAGIYFARLGGETVRFAKM